MNSAQNLGGTLAISRRLSRTQFGAILFTSKTKQFYHPKVLYAIRRLFWLEENYCWLITNNRTSMPGHLFDHMNAGHYIPGIMIVPDPLNVGEVLTELILIWGASLPGEYKDRIVYLPVSR